MNMNRKCPKCGADMVEQDSEHAVEHFVDGTYCRGRQLAAQAKQIAALSTERDAFKHHAERKMDELVAHRDKARGDYWAWQADSEDHPESLVCPILISADRMRVILDRAAKMERALRGLCDELREYNPTDLDLTAADAALAGVDELSKEAGK